MNVGQLRTALTAHDDDTEILVASDAEGNEFNKLYEVGLAFIEKNADKHGSADVIHPDDLDDYEEGDLELRVVLWP